MTLENENFNLPEENADRFTIETRRENYRPVVKKYLIKFLLYCIIIGLVCTASFFKYLQGEVELWLVAFAVIPAPFFLALPLVSILSTSKHRSLFIDKQKREIKFSYEYVLIKKTHIFDFEDIKSFRLGLKRPAYILFLEDRDGKLLKIFFLDQRLFLVELLEKIHSLTGIEIKKEIDH